MGLRAPTFPGSGGQKSRAAGSTHGEFTQGPRAGHFQPRASVSSGVSGGSRSLVEERAPPDAGSGAFGERGSVERRCREGGAGGTAGGRGDWLEAGQRGSGIGPTLGGGAEPLRGSEGACKGVRGSLASGFCSPRRPEPRESRSPRSRGASRRPSPRRRGPRVMAKGEGSESGSAAGLLSPGILQAGERPAQVKVRAQHPEWREGAAGGPGWGYGAVGRQARPWATWDGRGSGGLGAGERAGVAGEQGVMRRSGVRTPPFAHPAPRTPSRRRAQLAAPLSPQLCLAGYGSGLSSLCLTP